MSDFVSAQVTTEPSQLLELALSKINANLAANGYPAWSADTRSGNLGVLILDAVSQIAADNANVAATVLPAIFRAFGTKLANVPYGQGSMASVNSTWAFTSPAPVGGYLINAGTVVLIDGKAFYVQTDVPTATSATSQSVLLVAAETGVAYNDLGGINTPVDLNDELDWVAAVTTSGFTSGGADPESDDDYQNKLANALALQAPRPIIPSDFAQMVLSELAFNATGVTVGRATALDSYYPDGRPTASTVGSAQVISASITSGSTTAYINAPSATVCPTPGAVVYGPGILPGTTVATLPPPEDTVFYLTAAASATSSTAFLTVGQTSGYGPPHLIATGTTTNASAGVTAMTPPYYAAVPDVGARIVATGVPGASVVVGAPGSAGFAMSSAATLTGSRSLSISSWTNIARTVTTYVTDVNGRPLTYAQMDALQAWLNSFREGTFQAYVMPPSYNLIYVTTQIKVLPNYDATAVKASVVAAIQNYLNPGTWGSSVQSSTSWYNSAQGFSTVRYNKMIGVIEAVPGVDYVLPGSAGLAIGTAASPSGTSDIALVGPAPLPQAGTITVTNA